MATAIKVTGSRRQISPPICGGPWLYAFRTATGAMVVETWGLPPGITIATYTGFGPEWGVTPDGHAPR